MADPFIAEIRIVGFNFAPRGWAFCDGQLLPISQNTALFSLIGTTYGGDGRSTTALPNLQDRAPMHPGRGPGLTSRRLGQKVGIDTVTLVEAQIPSHKHTLRAYASGTSTANPGGSSLGNRPMYQTSTADLVDMASEAAGTTGGGQAHTNLQPYLTLNFCIALVGIFPSRS